MSLYLGDQKVGVSYAFESGEGTSITDEQLDELSAAAIMRTGYDNNKTIDGIINSLKEKWWIDRRHKIEVGDNVATWIRPAGWPDLDSLNLQMSGDDFIYMTYDANHPNSAICWHIETTNKQPATFDIGHITNGEYIVDETYTVNHNTNFIKWTENDYSGYLVLRVTGQILCCYSYNITVDGHTQTARQQPILERIAWVPHLARFCGSNQSWSTYLLQRDKVANGDGTPLTTLYYAWYASWNLHSLDITGLRTPNITNMDSTFNRLGFITELDLRHLVVNKVTTFSSCFSNSRFIRRIDMRGWVTEKATSFAYMFAECRSLYDLKGAWDFDTNKATNMLQMFLACWSLPEIHVENYVVGNVTNLSSIFSGCYQITELDLSKWRPEKVQTINSMFENCWNLKSINFNGWTTTGVITNAASLFSNCRSLIQVDISWLHITSACTSIGSMFSTCYVITEINIPNDWDVSGLSSNNYTAYNFFYNCFNLKKITGIANWNFQLTNTLSNMFSNCYSLEEVDVSNWNVSTVTGLSSIFANCWSLKHLDISKWRPINVTNIASMFDYCYSLDELNLNNFKPGQFTTMSAMFRYCVNLKSIGNISDWNTQACTTFANAFQDCHSLQALPDISDWDFSAATTTAAMFQGLFSVKEIALDNINLPQCTNVSTMFAYCRNLRKVHMTGWSIPKVTSTSASYFLGYCESLSDVTIDIPFIVNVSYYYDDSLTYQSLLNILNSLPTVATKRTLALMNSNINRLTAADKQIATDKNWTLSNS